MLYLTTRDKFDTYTVYHTLKNDTAPNGGLFFPFRLPSISMDSLKGKTFCECVADVLNLFFSAGLTGKEVEFSVGRYPIRVQTAHQKILVAQLWRNLDGDYAKMESRLADRIRGSEDKTTFLTSWVSISIRIAVLYGVFAQLQEETANVCVDVAVPAGDFRLMMATWYARKMGLPIGNIVCACDHDSVVWDFLRLGELRTSNEDAANVELERLICGTLGVNEVLRYCDIRQKSGVFTLDSVSKKSLSEGIFAAVVSSDRLNSVISNVYRTSSCVLDPITAAAYGGLMDYRARSGESRAALLLADQSPLDYESAVCDAMNIAAGDLKKLLSHS